jgi:hypothetical protein
MQIIRVCVSDDMCYTQCGDPGGHEKCDIFILFYNSLGRVQLSNRARTCCRGRRDRAGAKMADSELRKRVRSIDMNAFNKRIRNTYVVRIIF